MAQKFDARQTISRDVLSQLLGINGTELDDLLRAINKEFNAPLRISASSPADAKINFQPSEVEAADLAAKNITPVSAQIPAFPASTIDFQTGATTGGTINITFPNSTVGFFRRIGFSLDASGTIQAIFSAEAASLGALANAGTVFVKGALPIGWIDLEATAASPGRFKTAGSATNIIENKVGSSNRVHRIIGGGGTGADGGSGIGDDLNSLSFKASFSDAFDDAGSSVISGVDFGTGKTDPATHSISDSLFRLNYDASKTATTVGTAVTMSGAPTFTVKVGDMFIFGTQVKRITAVGSQTSYTLESALTSNISSQSVNVSQAVYSKDLNNFSGDGLAPSEAFTSMISQCMVVYEDSSTSGDTIFDINTTPVIGWSASADGSLYTPVQLRTTSVESVAPITDLVSSGPNLFIRFFANKTSGSGAVNVLGYRIFFHRDIQYSDQSIPGHFSKKDTNSVVFLKTSATTVSIKQGTTIEVGGKMFKFPTNTPVTMPSLTIGTDYAIYVCTDGTIRADSSFTAPTGYTTTDSRKIGGFHYGLVSATETVAGGSFATSGNGMIWTQTDVDAIKGINQFSLWDLKFRPSCDDPRGMALVANTFWVDIYLCNTNPEVNGTSKYNSNVASGTVFAKKPIMFGGNGTTTYSDGTWYTFNEVVRAFGKRLMREYEFNVAAFGVTENQSIGTGAVSTTTGQALGSGSATIAFTGRVAGYTSKWGLEQASGNHWTWGADSVGSQGNAWLNVNGGRGQVFGIANASPIRVLLGGHRVSAAFSGSRTSDWNNYPWLFNWVVGVRAVCDHMVLV